MRLTTALYPLNKEVPRNLLKKNQSYFIKQEKFKNIINNNLTRIKYFRKDSFPFDHFND